jgi:Protein of unknown function (DUF3955)
MMDAGANQQMRIGGPDAAAALLTLGFAWACAAFVRQPTLATFADDSVIYLVMAQVFSPYAAASQAAAAAFASEAFYPPLFPAVLALAGAAHDIAWAHVLTALILAASVPVAYLLGVRWLEDRRAAAVAVLCAVLLPAMWVNAKGILSEPLFCLLLVGTLCVLDAGGQGDRGFRAARLWMLAFLLAAVLLTRTAALAMIAAYALWALTRREWPFVSRVHAALPAVAAVALYFVWVLLRPAGTTDSNVRLALEHGGAFLGAENPLAAIGASLLRQANAIGEAWVGSVLLFWVEGRPVRTLLAGALGCLALAGLALRFAAGKADAWMMAGYLATFLAWPFYDQMGRFLFPVLPVLVLYAFWTLARATRFLRRPPVLGYGLLALLVVSLSAPALAFMVQRAQVARYAGIVDWYRTPDLVQARSRAQTHLDLFADMEEIGRRTRPEDRVMWVAPSYVALLAGRRGIAAPDSALTPAAYLQAVRDSGADYVFLSLYHPRDTLRTAAWQAGIHALTDHAKAVHVRARDGGGVVTSILLKIDR